MNQRYTLDELATATGLEKRTIRSYIQQGLIRGPEAQGRKAYYTSHHLARLKALRFLRQYEGRSLDEIRASLLGMADAEVEELARRFEEMSRRQAGLVTGSVSASSALDYIESLKLGRPAEAPETPETPQVPRLRARRMLPSALAGQMPEVDYSQEGEAFASMAELATPASPPAAGTPIDEVLTVFEQLAGGRQVPRRAKGEAWVVIRVTPDLELHVRGVNSADQLARLERIADHLREALLGGLSHD